MSASRWQAAQLRLTVFPVDLGSISVDGVWENLFETPPSDVSNRPREGVASVSAEYASGRLLFEAKPERADWQFFQPMKDEVPVTGFPMLGSLSDVLTSFAEPLMHWLVNCPKVNRLAFGAVLLLPADDHIAGYKCLNTLLHDVKVDPSSSDLMFQINHPRTYSHEGNEISINRLSKWSVVRSGGISLRVDMKTAETQSLLLEETRYACRLEVDINTAPNSLVASEGERHQPLFDHLIKLGVEIAERGDVS